MFEISSGNFSKPRWVHFYGARIKISDKNIAKKMNRFPSIASNYRGSLLLGIKLVKSQEPAFEVKDMAQDDQVEADSQKKVKFSARFDIEFV